MRSSRLKAAKLLQFEDDGGAEAAETTAAAKGGADEEESGQSLEAKAAAAEEEDEESGNEQDGRVPEQHDKEHEHEQGWRDFIPFVSLPESNSERLNRWTILWSCECPILH